MEERIQELEVRFTLQQDLLQQLSDIVARHDQEVARLRAQIDELRGLRTGGQLPLELEPEPELEDKPPHY